MGGGPGSGFTRTGLAFRRAVLLVSGGIRGLEEFGYVWLGDIRDPVSLSPGSGRLGPAARKVEDTC